MPSALESAILAASGAAFGLSFWPYPLGWLAWLALIPLLWTLRDKSWRQAFRSGWLFGTVSWMVGMFWLLRSLAQFFPDLPAVVVIFASICLYHGLMMACASGFACWVKRPLAMTLGVENESALAWAIVPAIVAMDGFFPMLFPVPLASTQYFHLPMLQSVDIFGIAGLAWLIAAFNAAAFTAAQGGKRRAPMALLFCLSLVFANELYGHVRIHQVDARARESLHQGRTLSAVLIQGSVHEDERFVKARFNENLSVYNALTKQALAAAKPDIILWPQNSYERSIAIGETDEELSHPTVEGQALDQVVAHDVAPTAPILLSGTAHRGPREYYVAFLVDPRRGFSGMVGKRDLTPLSEFLPFGDLCPVLYRMIPQGYHLSRGPHRLLTLRTGAKLGVYLCYESIKPDSAAEYARAGAEVFINPGNDNMGELEPEPEQDLRLGALRAIENRRFILRPTLSGTSAVIDPVGRIVVRIGRRQRSSVAAQVALLDDVTVQARIGGLFYWLSLPFLVVFAGLALRQKRTYHSASA